MPLTSKLIKEQDSRYRNGSVDGVYDSRIIDFVVSPSPCNNHGNHISPTPYSFYKDEEQKPVGNMIYKYYGNNQVTTNNISGVGVHSGAAAYLYDIADDPYNKALAKLVGQIKDSDLNLSTSVGEGRESLEMLGGIASNAAKFSRGLKKAVLSGDSPRYIRDLFRKAGATINDVKAIGGGVLYYNLGVAPLLADLGNLRDHVLSDKAEKVQFRVKARASAFQEMAESGPWLSYDQTNYAATLYRWASDSRRAELGAVISISNLHAYENWRAGIGLRPTLAWELTTLSFLVDYFFKIGEWLELYEAALCDNGISFESGYYTRSREQVSKYTCECNQIQGLGSYPFQEGATLQYHVRVDGWRRYTEKNRMLLTSFPTPKSPRITIPRASTQLLNCAALLSQTLSRGKR